MNEMRLRSNKILRVIFDSDMRCSHDGLRKIALKLKVKVDDLTKGEFIVFINTKQTMLKIFAAGNTIAFFKTPDGKRMNMNVIPLIPTYFNGEEFKYDKAVEALVKKEFGQI